MFEKLPASALACEYVRTREIPALPDLDSLAIGESYALPGMAASVAHDAAWRASQGQRRYRAFVHGGGVIEICRMPDWLMFTGADSAKAFDNEQLEGTTPPPVGKITDAAIDDMHSAANADLAASGDDGGESGRVEYTKAQQAAILKTLREYYSNDFAFVSKAKSKVSAKMHNDHVVTAEYIEKKIGKLAAFKNGDVTDITEAVVSDLCDENVTVKLDGDASEFYGGGEMFGIYPSILA